MSINVKDDITCNNFLSSNRLINLKLKEPANTINVNANLVQKKELESWIKNNNKTNLSVENITTLTPNKIIYTNPISNLTLNNISVTGSNSTFKAKDIINLIKEDSGRFPNIEKRLDFSTTNKDVTLADLLLILGSGYLVTIGDTSQSLSKDNTKFYCKMFYNDDYVRSYDTSNLTPTFLFEVSNFGNSIIKWCKFTNNSEISRSSFDGTTATTLSFRQIIPGTDPVNSLHYTGQTFEIQCLNLKDLLENVFLYSDVVELLNAQIGSGLGFLGVNEFITNNGTTPVTGGSYIARLSVKNPELSFSSITKSDKTYLSLNVKGIWSWEGSSELTQIKAGSLCATWGLQPSVIGKGYFYNGKTNTKYDL